MTKPWTDHFPEITLDMMSCDTSPTSCTPSHEELCDQALKDYKLDQYNDLIPEAIKYYRDNLPTRLGYLHSY